MNKIRANPVDRPMANVPNDVTTEAEKRRQRRNNAMDLYDPTGSPECVAHAQGSRPSAIRLEGSPGRAHRTART